MRRMQVRVAGRCPGRRIAGMRPTRVRWCDPTRARVGRGGAFAGTLSLPRIVTSDAPPAWWGLWLAWGFVVGHIVRLVARQGKDRV